jgi:hypothetical protein
VAVVRVANDPATIVDAQPATISGISLAVSWRRISPNALLFALKLSSNNNTQQQVDFRITADIKFDGLDDAACAAIPSGHGFTVLSERNFLTFITGGYPLVTNVSTFWFGSNLDREKEAWTQVTDTKFEGGDSAVSFTWQRIAIAPSATLVKNFLVKLGPFESSHVTLTLTFPDWSKAVPVDDPLSISGTALASPPATALAVSLFVQVDQDPSLLSDVPGAFQSGVAFGLELRPSSIGITSGSHTLTFFAVDPDGDVSDGQSATITIGSSDDGGGSGTVIAIVASVAGVVVVVVIVIVIWCVKRRGPEQARMKSDFHSGSIDTKAISRDELIPT